MTDRNPRKSVSFAPDQEMYQAYPTEEDQRRSRQHYEQPVSFFYPMLGGTWNVYSCLLWPAGVTDTTSAQEAKLDLLADLMALKPGMRILDVGCGWGGPLTYLCKTYGVRGVGLTVSPTQKQAAEARIAAHGVDATIIEMHWRDFADAEGFDVIYSDEVIVHFNDLGGFFSQCHLLLRESGRMVHKELHFTHRKYSRMSRGLAFLNQIFDSTGNYRTLGEELTLANDAGFEVQRVVQIPLTHYHKTVDRWLDQMRATRKELEALVGADTFGRYRTYLKLVRHAHMGSMMTLDVVVSHKIDLE
ncbi:MAG TPA: class I SAM-dependent methyltransferase [Chloroflexia bacterium]|nr:class I SAM-dependent methyltransferase [Chloroflexia bacterium]